MKTVPSLICAFAGLLLTGTGSYAQVTDGFSFGLKAGANRMSTKIINRPSNYNGQLRGVGVSNGFQVGAWATLPVSRWLFVDTDLYFQQRENKYEDPSNSDIIFAYNTYRYAGVSGRIGFMYKGAFVSIGPEMNVLLATKTMGQNEAQGVEWGINARLGYQYRRVRIEAFYTKPLTHYEQKTFIVQGDKLQHLFYGNTLGLSLGVRLFGGKERR